jgi:hypothetical protein
MRGELKVENFIEENYIEMRLRIGKYLCDMTVVATKWQEILKSERALC